MCKIVLTRNHKVWSFNATDLLYIFIEFHRNALELKKIENIGVGRRLDRIRSKNLLAQTILDKIFGTKWSNPVKMNRKRKVRFQNIMSKIVAPLFQVQKKLRAYGNSKYKVFGVTASLLMAYISKLYTHIK